MAKSEVRMHVMAYLHVHVHSKKMQKFKKRLAKSGNIMHALQLHVPAAVTWLDRINTQLICRFS